MEGKGKLRLRDETFELYPGVLFSYGTNSNHDLWADSEHPMKKYFVAFDLPVQLPPLLAHTIKPGEVRYSLDFPALRALFDGVITEGRKDGIIHLDITSRYLELILLKSATAVEIDNRQRNGGFRSYQESIGYIEGHFLTLNGLSDLSSAINLDSTYICRLFRRFGRETPHQCITRHKLNYAAEQLVDPRSSIKQIALMTGYEDPFYFSRLFKKRFGCSPKQLRDKLAIDSRNSPADE